MSQSTLMLQEGAMIITVFKTQQQAAAQLFQARELKQSVIAVSKFIC